MIKRIFNYNTLIIFILLLLSVFFYRNSLNDFPSNIHVQLQNNRFALALGFANGNYNILQPKVLLLNNNPSSDTDQKGKTAAYLPVNEYIIGMIMKISNCQQPIVFRMYMLLICMAGLFALFKLSVLLNFSLEKSIFLVLFAFSSPIFAFYSIGFLPEIADLSIFVIGFYFYFRSILQNRNTDLYLGFTLMLIASLSSPSFIVFLILIVINDILYFVKFSSLLRRRMIYMISALVIFFVYFFYNLNLGNKYGCISQLNFTPFKSAGDFLNIYDVIKHLWLFQYFSIYHYIAIVLMFFFVAVYAIFTERVDTSVLKFWKKLLILLLAGSILLFLMMAKQFVNADYLVINTFFPAIIFLVLILLKLLPDFEKLDRVIFIIMLFVFSASFLMQAITVKKDKQKLRSDFDTQQTINDFYKSDKLLNELKISENARLVLINLPKSNIPLNLLKRSGFVLEKLTNENANLISDWKYDNFVFQKRFLLSDIIPSYPEIISNLIPIGENNNLFVFGKSKTDKTMELTDVLGLTEKDKIFSVNDNFEADNQPNWLKNGNSDAINYLTPPFGINLVESREFGPTYSLQIEDKKVFNTSYILIESYLRTKKELTDLFFVCSIENRKGIVSYTKIDLKNYIKEFDKFNKTIIGFDVKDKIKKGNILKIYLWNLGKNNITVDDIKIDFYNKKAKY